VLLFSSKGKDKIVKEGLKQHDPDILSELGQTARAMSSQLPAGAHVEAIHLIVRAENGGVHSIAWKAPEKKH
jgi:hypothetical protein